MRSTAASARPSSTDGAVYFGTTLYGGRVAFRPVICNWMTRDRDVDEIADTVLRLGAAELAQR